ncbi:MAG: response regulator [Ignavibacteriaceae bacterium]
MKAEKENVTVLIVDDSELICHTLKTFFNDYNLEVLTSHDGLDGIQKAVVHKPALIFLDLLMPNFDGIKMLQVIKVLDNLKNIPVIVISGNTNRSNVVAAIETGADRVISKPLNREIIFKNMTEILGDDFLSKLKKASLFSTNDVKDIRKELCGYFLSGFPKKKENILRALNESDHDSLKYIMHEIRGIGGTIGYPNLSLLGSVIEDQLGGKYLNWEKLRVMCDQVFTAVNEIEISFKKLEK